MTEPTLEDYLLFLKSPDADVRRNAAWWLGRQRDIRIVEALIPVLNDPDPTVRLRVAESLGNMKDDRAVMPLVTALSDDDVQVRTAVINALGLQGDWRALDAIVMQLGAAEAQIRMAAADALAKLPDARAVGALVGRLLEDEDPDVRYSASRALGEIGQPAVDLLLLALHGEPDVSAKLYMAEILAKAHDQRAVTPLKVLTEDDDEAVRETAKWALKQLGAS
ncbi:MAG: HEAT repeat domain-containing protein [bacterium]|nr:HEAT repeat domain-containing protein [bacterium]